MIDQISLPDAVLAKFEPDIDYSRAQGDDMSEVTVPLSLSDIEGTAFELTQWLDSLLKLTPGSLDSTKPDNPEDRAKASIARALIEFKQRHPDEVDGLSLVQVVKSRLNDLPVEARLINGGRLESVYQMNNSESFPLFEFVDKVVTFLHRLIVERLFAELKTAKDEERSNAVAKLESFSGVVLADTLVDGYLEHAKANPDDTLLSLTHIGRLASDPMSFELSHQTQKKLWDFMNGWLDATREYKEGDPNKVMQCKKQTIALLGSLKFTGTSEYTTLLKNILNSKDEAVEYRKAAADALASTLPVLFTYDKALEPDDPQKPSFLHQTRFYGGPVGEPFAMLKHFILTTKMFSSKELTKVLEAIWAEDETASHFKSGHYLQAAIDRINTEDEIAGVDTAALRLSAKPAMDKLVVAYHILENHLTNLRQSNRVVNNSFVAADQEEDRSAVWASLS